MDTSIVIKGKNKDVEFYPFLLNKDTIGFRTYSLSEISFQEGDILLNENYKGIEIRVNKKRVMIKLEDETIKNLLEMKKQEVANFRAYYNRLINGNEEVIGYISDEMYFVKPKTSWDMGYAPYWDKMFRYMVEQKTNGAFKDNDSEDQLQIFINDKFTFNMNKEQVKVHDDGGDKYIKMNFNQFIKNLVGE
jgi:hypothetical protein